MSMLTYGAHPCAIEPYRFNVNGIGKIIAATESEVLASNGAINLELEFAIHAAKHKTLTAVIPMNLKLSRIFHRYDTDDEDPKIGLHELVCMEASEALDRTNLPYRCVFIYPQFRQGGSLQDLITKNALDRTIRLSAALQLLSTIQQYEDKFCLGDIMLNTILWQPTGATMTLMINGNKKTIKTGGFRFYFSAYGSITNKPGAVNSREVVTLLINVQDDPTTITTAAISTLPYTKFKSSLNAPIDKYMDAISPHLTPNQRIMYHEWLTSYYKWDDYLLKSGLAASIAVALKNHTIPKSHAARIIKAHNDFKPAECANAIVKSVQGTAFALDYLIGLS